MTTSAAVAELRLPASSAFISVLRLTTAGLAARLQFSLDEVEDARVAVSEAGALLLRGTTAPARTDPAPGGLDVRFDLAPHTLGVSMSAPAPRSPHADPVTPGTPVNPAAQPGTDPDLGWRMLTAVVDDVRIEDGQDRRRVSFTVTAAQAR